VEANNRINLPNYLQPYRSEGLIRIGSNFDGGYLVSLDDIKLSKNLISFGIALDWGFEKEFKKVNKKISLYSFDGSVGYKYFKYKLKTRIKNFINNLNKERFKKLYEMILLALDFSFFYRFNIKKNKIFHYEKFVNLKIDKKFEDDFILFNGYQPETISFEEINPLIVPNSFLSIDIEGGEYEILEHLINQSINMSGLVIEFHDVHKNMEKIKNFIEDFELNLIHLHINNFGEIIEKIPSVFELTFSRYASITNELVDTLPNKLDEINNSEGIDYKIFFI